jgi:hypothetical protein
MDASSLSVSPANTNKSASADHSPPLVPDVFVHTTTSTVEKRYLCVGFARLMAMMMRVNTLVENSTIIGKPKETSRAERIRRDRHVATVMSQWEALLLHCEAVCGYVAQSIKDEGLNISIEEFNTKLSEMIVCTKKHAGTSDVMTTVFKAGTEAAKTMVVHDLLGACKEEATSFCSSIYKKTLAFLGENALEPPVGFGQQSDVFAVVPASFAPGTSASVLVCPSNIASDLHKVITRNGGLLVSGSERWDLFTTVFQEENERLKQEEHLLTARIKAERECLEKRKSLLRKEAAAIATDTKLLNDMIQATNNNRSMLLKTADEIQIQMHKDEKTSIHAYRTLCQLKEDLEKKSGDDKVESPSKKRKSKD